jgi:GntR family transcriptional regulator, N-acetylglucosamine utilization regulator
MMSVLDRTAARIDRRSPVPFYFQLKQLIRDEIAGERWLPGERIPSEHALCDHFAVSRTTVRQALAELESEGLLVKRKGRGTFVAEPRSSSWFLQSSHGFHDEATRAGHEVTSRVMRREVEPLPQWAALALDLPTGSNGVTLERVRYVDGELVMYVESHLLEALADVVLGTELETGSLYGALKAQHGLEVAGGRRVVEATTARDELASLLQIQPGAAVLQVQAVSWDANMRPFECYRAWHRSDRTTIEVQVLGQRAAETAGLDPTTLRLGER